jgi:hypothetical protein
VYRTKAILHPGHYLALGQDQDHCGRQDKTKEGEKCNNELQEAPGEDNSSQFAPDIVTKYY